MSDEAEIEGSSAGRFLTFRIGSESFGVPIGMVREIIGTTTVTTIPEAPEVIKGIINLRGKIVPMLCMRKKFHLPEVEPTKETSFIITDIEEVSIGFIVDAVQDVREFSNAQIEPVHNAGRWKTADYILGVGKEEGEVVILLDLTKIMAKDKFTEILSSPAA